MQVKYIDETRSLMLDMLSSENYELDKHIVVLSANYQTEGRGQHDHRWESSRGENLLLGIIVHHPKYTVNTQKSLSDDVALAVQITLDNWLQEKDLKSWMKQPNDIYVGCKKLAGLLIEHDVQGGIIETTRIGLGININQTVFESDAPNPSSLALLIGHEVDRAEVLSLFLQNLTRLMRIPFE